MYYLLTMRKKRTALPKRVDCKKMKTNVERAQTWVRWHNENSRQHGGYMYRLCTTTSRVLFTRRSSLCVVFADLLNFARQRHMRYTETCHHIYCSYLRQPASYEVYEYIGGRIVVTQTRSCMTLTKPSKRQD